MNIGRNLKLLRENNGLTQTSVAEKLNIQRVQYNQYENDYFNIPIKHLINLGTLYRVSIDYIFGLSSDKKYKNISYMVDNHMAGLRLLEFRKNHKNLTQEKLANILNTTRSSIAFNEKGRNLIATPFLYTICKKYNISADYLLGKIDFIPDWCNNYLKNQ